MYGLMMDMPLTITSIMKHADLNYPDSEIVSVTADNPRHRCTYSEAFRRTRQLANALSSFGIKTGDRVATLAWNDYRHLELYFGISCIGAITHTINPRLFPEQITYIINHAEDRVLFVDPLIVPLIEKIESDISRIEKIIILTDDKNIPANSLKNTQSYESFIGDQPDLYDWPDLEENTASSLCYTSGTTGSPRGVLYSHRSTVLHCYAAVAPDVFCLSIRDVMMPVVPMFHVNAWGLTYTGPMIGAKLVLPGPKMGDGETLFSLIAKEKVTFTAGVPTIWMALLSYLSESGNTLETLEQIIVGGAACPKVIMDEFREKHNATVRLAWGMTETSPIGTVNRLKPGLESLDEEELEKIKMKQGRVMYGVEMKTVDDNNVELPRDGQSSGMVKVRGPWICKDYFRLDGGSDVHDDEGWFSTGDVATIDRHGYMHITDRAKDVIKSGGEWISSIDLENEAVGHSKIAEAAVIGIAHPKWTERPLLIVVKKPGEDPDKEEILDYLRDRVAKFWVPDDVVFVDEIPHTATGKIKKLELREQFKDYKFSFDD
jgi:3-(methylthio)propionyl---CoA ligase